MSSCRLVPMGGVHLDAIAAIEVQSFSVPWSRDMLAEELENVHASYIVAEGEDGAVLGYAGLHVVLDEGYITNIAVAPEHRRKGIAATLLGAFCRFGAAKLAFLTLEVRASNAPAIALYRACGFEESGLRKDYYVNPKEDAMIMTREFARG